MALVADLVTDLHTNIDSIHKCIESLSDISHEKEVERLEREREAQIDAIRQKIQQEGVELECQRKVEEATLAARRKEEEEVITARRKKEDDERRRKIEEEEYERLQRKRYQDELRGREAEERKRAVQEQIEKQLDALEDEIDRRVDEGRRMLMSLDQQRRAINAKIDAALNKPMVIPDPKFRSRAKTEGVDKRQAQVAHMKGSRFEPTHGSQYTPRNTEPTTSPVNTLPPEAHLALPIRYLVEEESPNSKVLDDGKSLDIGKSPAKRNAEAAKAWWDAHQLESMAKHKAKEPLQDDSQLKNTLDEKSTDFQSIKPDVYHFSEAARPGPSFKTSNDGEVRFQRTYRFSEPNRPRPTFIYHFLEAQRPSPHFHNNDRVPRLYRFFEGSRPNPLFDERGTPHESRSPSRIYQFSEDNRPAPALHKDSEIFQVFRFKEDQRPGPSLIYRFSEKDRPKPSFDLTQVSSKLYRFFEGQRPTPIFSNVHMRPPPRKSTTQATTTRARGVFRFSEENRPSPRLIESATFPRTYRFFEEDRPSPSFIYRFSEECRPSPKLNENFSRPQIHHFLEAERPSPAFEGHNPAISIPQSIVSKERMNTETYRFSEQSRPLPLFTEDFNIPKTYQFLEKNRPSPLFIYHFSEENRPFPIFEEIPSSFQVHRFFESERPGPSFRGHACVKSIPQTILSKQEAYRRTYHFFEQARPQPSFKENTSIPIIYRFSEETRPPPLFVHHFLEDRRPRPIFSEVATYKPLLRFFEANRPMPLFEHVSRNTMVDDVFIPKAYHHFYEEKRPLPLFAERMVEQPVYRFSENRRPCPNFIYRFSEEHRPYPAFSHSCHSEPVYRFIEERRPRPDFDKGETYDEDETAEPSSKARLANAYPAHENKMLAESCIESSAFPDFHGELETDHAEPEKPQRRSGVFGSLVDTLKSEVPLVSRLVNSQQYNHVPEYDYDPYSDEDYEHNIEHELPKDLHTSEPLHSDWHSYTHPSEGFPPRPTSSGLRVRTHTTDSLPAFETNAQSDDEDSPTTPSDTVSGSILEHPDEPDYQSSWSPSREVLHHREGLPAMKPQASPLRAHFEQTYPKYVPSRSSVSALEIVESLKSPKSVEPVISDVEDIKSRHPANVPSKRYSALGIFQDHQTPDTDAKGTLVPTTQSIAPASASLSLSGTPRRPTLSNRYSLSHTPVEPQSLSSVAPSQNPVFQKTRSLFEAPAQPSTHMSPSLKTRPSSLTSQSALYEKSIIIPRNLDGDNKPPSPAFILPQYRYRDGDRGMNATGGANLPPSSSSSFLGGLSRIVGATGLERDNCDPGAWNNEKAKLLGGEDGY